MLGLANLMLLWWPTPNARGLEQMFEIGWGVHQKSSEGGKGKIEIPFDSETDLRRIADILDI